MANLPAVYDSASDDVADTQTVSGRFCSCSALPPHLSTTPQTADDPISEPPATSVAISDESDSPGDIPKYVSDADDPTPRSIAEIALGEQVLLVETPDAADGIELSLTNRRVIARGGGESRTIFASMRLEDLGTVSVLRVPGSRRMLYWGLLGIVTSLGIWQSLDGVGNLRFALTALVALSSVGLLMAFIVRAPNVRLVFRSVFGDELSADFPNSRLEVADAFASHAWNHAEKVKRRRGRRNRRRSRR